MRAITIVIYAWLLLPASAASFKLSETTVESGKQAEFLCPIAPLDKLKLHKEGNTPVAFAKGAIVVPTNFVPHTNWNVLIINATTDGSASSIAAMRSYTNVALSQGWIVLAAEGPQGKPKLDYPVWRLTMLKSVLAHLHKHWAFSTNWPVAFAGFSGGAKWSGLLAPAFDADCKILGVFMGGCNEDRVSAGYAIYKPGQSFREGKLFLSSGTSDKIATPIDHENVRKNLIKNGFNSVALHSFEGGHRLWNPHLQAALEWFSGKTNSAQALSAP